MIPLVLVRLIFEFLLPGEQLYLLLNKPHNIQFKFSEECRILHRAERIEVLLQREGEDLTLTQLKSSKDTRFRVKTLPAGLVPILTRQLQRCFCCCRTKSIDFVLEQHIDQLLSSYPTPLFMVGSKPQEPRSH